MARVILPSGFVRPMQVSNRREMAIPESFTHKLINISSIARLRRIDTRLIWNVTVSTYEDSDNNQHYKLTAGWEECVRDNNIHLGDFVSFRYCGNSVFTIEVYGPNVVPRPIDFEYGEVVEQDAARGRRPAYHNQSEAGYAASTLLAYSNVPCFGAALTSSYYQINTVNVSLVFARQHLSAADIIPAILVVKAREYRVSLFNTFRNGVLKFCKIRTGFKEVIDNARLKQGDVLAFELVEEIPVLKFRVTVF